MNESSFARSFLAMLDAKPIRYQADYAVDLKTYEPEYPVCLAHLETSVDSFLLPRMPHAMRRSGDETRAGIESPPSAAPGFTISLKSSKNPQLSLKLHSQPLDMAVSELKQSVAREAGLNTIDKIRLLYRKRPCADSKTVRELLGAESDSPPELIEFSVMVMGGMPQKGEEIANAAMTDSPVAVGPSGAVILEEQEFWSDLEGFLQQRLKDANVANQATSIFREAWSNRPNR